MPSELLRICTAGAVDDGKSTLIGRLLYDSKSLFEDQLQAVQRQSAQRGDERLDLALLTDGLRAEREQGITIDVAYRYFATPARKFILADSPGHARYTRNMITAASAADVALLIVDVRKGLREQTKRHAVIASLLGIPHMVVCVNKMDLVGWSHGQFEEIQMEFAAFAARLRLSDVWFVPISALDGHNIVKRSPHSDWYQGPPLLPLLEELHVASDRNLIDPRFPVQYVIRPQSDEHHGYRGYAGKVAGGVFRKGDEVLVLPSGERSRIKRIETFDGELSEAFPPMSVTIHLEDELDVGRGDVLCRPHNQPQQSRRLDAMVCWLAESALQLKKRYVLRHLTRELNARVEQVLYRFDIDTLHRDEDTDHLELNEIGRAVIALNKPLCFDQYSRNRETGSFVLIDPNTNNTVAVGMLLGPSQAPTQERSPNVRWHASKVTRQERAEQLGMRGGTVWLTGLPASGKSTLAVTLEQHLVRSGIPAFVLDGDNLRHGLNGDLGFDRADREENLRRTAHAARLLAEAGVLVIVSTVSPYHSSREAARRVHEEGEVPFLEVFVDTPLEVCEQRDPKGLYAKARRGELEGMTGVDDPYELPETPDLRVDGTAPLEEALGRILACLEKAGLV